MSRQIDSKSCGARTTGLAALAIAVFFSTAPVELGAEAVSPEWAQNWQDDLRFLASKLPRVHPEPFTKFSQAEFDAQIEQLIEAAPGSTHTELAVGLAQSVAALGDGHTRLTLPLPEGSGFFLGHAKTPPPLVPGLVFDYLPLRLIWLEDGLIVRSASREHAATVGAQVIKIGDKTVEQAIVAVSPVVHRDNQQQLDYQLPDYLVLPDVLAATGVTKTKDEIEFTLAPIAGEPFIVHLEPVAESEPIEWVELSEKSNATEPLYRRNNDRKFWFELLEDERTIYFQYNEVGDEEDETLAAFADRLFDAVDNNPVDRLIIDLRRNRGGSNGLNRAVLHGLIRSTKLQTPGSLFAITGSGTFSAAMMFSVDLAKHTSAIFVGSPTGSAPNHFGDSRKTRLPRTGLTVRISTLYWQSDPRDDRHTIEPHLPVAATMNDYRRGHDAALETILRPGRRIAVNSEHAGVWHGKLMAFRRTFDFTVELELTGSSWSGEITFPELGAIDLELEELTVEDDRVRFVLPDPDSERRFLLEGGTDGQRIYGNFSNDSRTAPFVLVRQES